MNSIRNGLRTWIDAISGMTAPVHIDATPQNQTAPFIQLQSVGLNNATLDSSQQQEFQVRSYSRTAAEAHGNALAIATALEAVRNTTMTDRIAECAIVRDIVDDVATDDAGKEVGLFVSIASCTVFHRSVS